MPTISLMVKSVIWLDPFDPERVHLGTARIFGPISPTPGKKIISNCCSLHIDDCHDLFGPHIVEAVKEAGLGKLIWLNDIEVELEDCND